MHMRHIVICGLSASTISFHIISKTARIFEKKLIEQKMWDLIFPTNLSETYLILRRTARDVIINV